MYFKGCSEIKKPADANGKEIKVGDELTWDFHDDLDEIKDWMRKPIFKVELHPSGKGLCAKGIHKDLYLHDFRFKYCEIVHKINDITTCKMPDWA
jgi:hypothetical protein